MIALLHDELPKACNNCEKKCSKQAIYDAEFYAGNQIIESNAIYVYI